MQIPKKLTELTGIDHFAYSLKTFKIDISIDCFKTIILKVVSRPSSGTQSTLDFTFNAADILSIMLILFYIQMHIYNDMIMLKAIT